MLIKSCTRCSELETELAQTKWLIKQHQRMEKDNQAATERFKQDILWHRDRQQLAVRLLASQITCASCPISNCNGQHHYAVTLCIDKITAWAMNIVDKNIADKKITPP